MAIEKDVFYWATCDRCEEPITRDDNDAWPLDSSAKEARMQVEYYDGRIEDDGSFTCCSCIEDEPPAEADHA